MDRLTELTSKLPLARRKEVEDFAAFLVAREKERQDAPHSSNFVDVEKLSGMFANESVPTKNQYEGWAGCLADIHPEMSDAQFNELILDEWAKAAED